MFTIEPVCRPIIEGRTALQQRKTLLSTTATSRSQVASSICSTSSPSAIAALLTRTSTGPSSAATSPTKASTSRRELTSACTDRALPPSVVISAVTASARSGIQSTTATFAPSPANLCAITRPIPEPAPVTITTRPSNRIPWSGHRDDGVDLELESRQVRLDRGPFRHGLTQELCVDLVQDREVGHVPLTGFRTP